MMRDKQTPQQVRGDKGSVKLPYYVYILAKAPRSTFYTGVTNDLVRRVWEHKQGVADGFTKKYGIKMLVYYEVAEDINAAIQREKIIKKWKRSFKYDAIQRMNPEWRDLYDDITGQTDAATGAA
jgi:putative endonuclease